LGQNSGLSRKRQKTLTEENEANKDWRFFFVPFACSRFIGVAFCSTSHWRAFGFGREGILAAAAEKAAAPERLPPI
jgi:hypothetical protein